MTSKKTVSVGVVGTSWWTDAMYLPALKQHEAAAVVAVCGRHPERASQFAARWEIPHFYTDYDQMLENETLDAVIIAGANDSHYAMTMKALERDLHVLCEKPLALNYQQAKEMAEAAEARGVKHMVPFTYRFMPTSRYLKELIDNGYLGSPYHLNMRYYTGYGRDGSYMWRFDLEKSGAGVVGDLGAHWLYLARWFYGEIKAVHALLGYHVEREPRPDGSSYARGDDSAMLLLEFENGTQGVIHVTSVCYEDTPFGQSHHMEFHGSGGTLYTYTDWDEAQLVYGARVGEGKVRKLTIPEHIWGKARRDKVHNTYRDVFREEDHMTRGFITAIVEGTSLEPDFHDGARIQQIIQAAQLSARRGCRVMVDEVQ